MSVRESIRVAEIGDLEALLPLMRGYYRDDDLAFDEAHARKVMARLLLESQWGCVLIAEANNVAIGYAALCLGFSVQLGGNDAFLDELFVEPESRRRGVAQRLIDALENHARRCGVRALHLEVDKRNAGAMKLYAARQFRARDRYHLLTKVLE